MAITYKLDIANELIYTEVSGNLTVNMTVEYFEQLQKDSNLQESMIEIVDFAKVSDFTISYEDMRSITQVYQIAKSEKSISGTIFLAKTDIAYGIARMLHTLHQITNEHHAVKIVRSEEELNETIEQLRSNP